MLKSFCRLCGLGIPCCIAVTVEGPSPPNYQVKMQPAWIPMKYGVRLAATLYVPQGAKPGDKFPALLEYLPYRKFDGAAPEDYPKHTYFARRGYVSVRVDISGFGASEGAPPEREYSEQEQQDRQEALRDHGRRFPRVGETTHPGPIGSYEKGPRRARAR